MIISNEFRFTRICARKYGNVILGTSRVIIGSVRLLSVGIKEVNNDNEEIYVVLNENNQEIAERLLDQLERKGNLQFDLITGKWIED